MFTRVDLKMAMVAVNYYKIPTSSSRERMLEMLLVII
jgi:hypothetical protein